MYDKEITIRTLHKMEELNEVRMLESKIWGQDDSIPVHQTITAVKNGGLVLGAYCNGQMVGFQYSFPGFNGKSVYLCSHVLATDKDHRNMGIGEKLKLAQRKEARKLGYSLITWTYDPLESTNGYLNIGKLGGECSTYIPNCYGDMKDLLNNGIPSDRFLVEWKIDNETAMDTKGLEVKIEHAVENSLIRWEVYDAGYPIPSAVLDIPNREQEHLFAAVPKNFRKIREIDMDAALKWRLAARDLFTNLFQQGWRVTGFKKADHVDLPVHFYILSKSGKGEHQYEN